MAKLNIMDYSLLIGIHDRNRRGMEFTALNQEHGAEKVSVVPNAESGGSSNFIPPPGVGTRSNTPLRRAGSLHIPLADISELSRHGGESFRDINENAGNCEVPMACDIDRIVSDIEQFGIGLNCISIQSENPNEKYGDSIITGDHGPSSPSSDCLRSTSMGGSFWRSCGSWCKSDDDDEEEEEEEEEDDAEDADDLNFDEGDSDIDDEDDDAEVLHNNIKIVPNSVLTYH